ncbi:MAG TPA: dihydroorotate dehydrogenase (quinone) [Candidatus Paceibacterota bacterium]|nr:dihydroorotate dehydrogenase (quinone) [Candidatus Paceibacterota bacterium]
MIGILYRNILKPILFLFPADDVHDFFLKAGRFFGKSNFIKFLVCKTLLYKNTALEQKIAGIAFENPIGLAAGFDYDADLIGILPSVGFGFHTVGTVTYLPYKGNERPMLGRLPKSKSLLVNKGFKSMGINSVMNKIRNQKKQIPLGISIGSTNRPYENINNMIGDIISSFKKAISENYFDYFEINISCPNLVNIANLPEKLDTPSGLDKLLNELSRLNISRPVFIKMYLEKSIEDTENLAEVASRHPYITGFIFSNLAKDRNNPAFDREEIKNAGKGNFSGKPTERITNNLISAIYKKYKNRFIIIGCGGVFNGKDAYEKIKRGASLIQMITGMIYEGPQQIGVINRELAGLLYKDGYKNISEAVGTHKE